MSKYEVTVLVYRMNETKNGTFSQQELQLLQQQVMEENARKNGIIWLSDIHSVEDEYFMVSFETESVHAVYRWVANIISNSKVHLFALSEDNVFVEYDYDNEGKVSVSIKHNHVQDLYDWMKRNDYIIGGQFAKRLSNSRFFHVYTDEYDY